VAVGVEEASSTVFNHQNFHQANYKALPLDPYKHLRLVKRVFTGREIGEGEKTCESEEG